MTLPGVEIRPENVPRQAEEVSVTLEEGGPIQPGRSKAGPGVGKRRRRLNTIQEENNGDSDNIKKEEEEAPQPKKRGRKKKNESDEDYVPEMESKKTQKPKKTPTNPYIVFSLPFHYSFFYFLVT